MSKLAQDLQTVLNVETPDFQSAVHAVQSRDSTPGAKAFSKLSHRQLTGVLKTARLFFAGSTTWKTGMEAMEATSNHLQSKLVPKLIELMGLGIYVGKENVSEDENFERIFDNKDVQVHAAMEGLKVAMDEEARKAVIDFLGGQVAGAMMAMGWEDVPAHETSHVWDVWYAALAGGSATIYQAGYQLGCKWREEEILNGIFEATERGTDERT